MSVSWYDLALVPF